MKKTVAIVCCSALIIALSAFLYFYIPSLSVDLDETKLYSNANVDMLDAKGNRLSNCALTNDGLEGEGIPDNLKNAFICVEDKRFYEHNGTDAYRMAGALWKNIKSLSFKEGASTISQQLIKNTHLSGEKTLTRKFAEIRLAKKLEKKFSKDEILNMYLSTLYFGNGVYGVDNAANYYFDKSVGELSLAECAMLAGIINAPGVYAPDKNLEKSLDRRKIVLEAMLKEEKITNEQFDRAVAEEIDIKKIGSGASSSSYLNMALYEAAEILNISVQEIRRSGLKIYTFFDKNKQDAIIAAAKSRKIKTESGGDAQKMAISLNNASCGIEAFWSDSKANPYFNRRQIGSAAKPIVALAPSFEQKKAFACSLILDEETNFGGYSPKNINGKYDGWISARNAMARSKNVPAVKLLNALDKEKLKSLLVKMNFIKADEEIKLNMALGCFENGITIKTLAAAYAALANGGVFKTPSFVRKIEDKDGKILYRKVDTGTQVLRSDSAYLATDVLKDVIKHGTASLMDLNMPLAGKTGTVGKSGCKNNSDALFCCYSPTNTAVFWTFSDYSDLLEGGTSGSTAPVLMAKKYFERIDDGKKDFVCPNTVVTLKIDKVELEKNGKILLANSFLPSDEIVEEKFSVFNAPTKVSTRRVVQAKQTKEREKTQNKRPEKPSLLQEFLEQLKENPLFSKRQRSRHD